MPSATSASSASFSPARAAASAPASTCTPSNSRATASRTNTAPSAHDDLRPGGPNADQNYSRGLTYFLAVRKPIIAAINGPCAGMGFAFAAVCDVRFAGEDAFFVNAFAQRGLVAEHATSWILPRLLGPARALDIMWTGRRVSAQEALQLGLVNRVLPKAELVPSAQDYVRELARTTSRRSLMTMKQQVYCDLMRPLGPAMADTEALMDQSFTWPDFAEGVASFTERPRPQFPPSRPRLNAPPPASSYPPPRGGRGG